jgi:PTS system mannose-specific IID component
VKKRQVLFSVLLRSYFIQALWNFEKMQNIGFAFGIMPFLKFLYPDPVERKSAVLRHVNFFNTNPYMASIIFGMVASFEEDIKNDSNIQPEQVNVLKNNMAGPLAAIGDTFFWATWRPFSVLVAIGAALLIFKTGIQVNMLIVPGIFVFVYNVVPVPFRYWSLNVSYNLHNKIIELIASLEFQYIVDVVKMVSVVVLAFVFILYFFSYAHTLFNMGIFFAVFVLSILFGCFRFSSTIMFFGVIALSVIVAYLRG